MSDSAASSSNRPIAQCSMQVPNFSNDDRGAWETLVDQSVAADAAGIDRMVFSDHVVFGENLEAYGDPARGGAEGGKQPTGPDGHWLEPITLLTWVGSRTTHLRLGTNILLAALRRPVVLAKQLATLDVLSGGRLDIGVGVGWQEEEYTAAGLSYKGRGRTLDHTLEVCQALWTEQTASYDSDELTFEDIHMMPKPAQDGGVPIWVSGRLNKRVVERLARFGDGWIPWGPEQGDLVNAIPRMKELVAEAGGDATNFQVTGSAPMVRNDDGSLDLEATMDGIPALVEAGQTDFRFRVPIPDDREQAIDALTPLVQAFRSAVGRR